MKKISVLLILLILTGCETTMQQPRYAASADNNQKLQSYSGSLVQVASISIPVGMCLSTSLQSVKTFLP